MSQVTDKIYTMLITYLFIIQWSLMYSVHSIKFALAISDNMPLIHLFNGLIVTNTFLSSHGIFLITPGIIPNSILDLSLKLSFWYRSLRMILLPISKMSCKKYIITIRSFSQRKQVEKVTFLFKSKLKTLPIG